MKIFISYGHLDHTDVVDQLFDSLIQADHEPWKDDRYEGNSGIPAGRDFTEVIYKAIDAADFVIAFVTQVTKDKPYCRDERQYAYNVKGNHFIQIRMDYAEITLGNASSYIDMSDVVSSNGSIHQRLFEDKLKSLFAAFRDPASFAAGGLTPWTKFDTHLKVPGALKYHDFIASLDDEDFVGRQWLLEKCKAWAMDSAIPCRLFVILGEAGTGKTAFIRRLAADDELVRSVHICVYDKPSTRTARDTLKDLSYVLAQNNNRYFEFLKMRDFEQLRDMTLDGLFEFLFIEPLKNENQKYLLVIDALDEMEEATGFKPLMRLFRQYAQQLNPNISFLVTGRPDAYITDMLKTVAQGKQLESVLLDKNVSKEDLESFIRRKLEQLNCYSQSLADKLLEACDGNFEYLSLLFREALEEGLSVSDSMKIPRGLNERYAQYLDRRMEMADCSRLTRDQRRLLSVLCAAYEPLPISVLCAVTGMEDYEVSDELELFGSLIRRITPAQGEARICLFTKSFRDFLLSKSFDKYFADHKLGTKLMAQYLMDKCHSEKALKKYPYIDQYGFVHLLQYAAEEPEDALAYCKEFSENEEQLVQRIAGALHLGDGEVIRCYWSISKPLGLYSNILNRLKARRSADTLSQFVSLLREENSLSSALTLEADMLLWDPSAEANQRAESLYREAMQIVEKKNAATPSAETRRFLFILYNRMGLLEKKKQTPESHAEALRLFRLTLEIVEENYRNEANFANRRDLVLAYENLGEMAKRELTAEGDAAAVAWYEKSLELCQQNHQEKPSTQTRRDLSIAYSNLGSLAKRQNTSQSNIQAEHWYLQSLTIAEDAYRQDPCYQTLRDLTLVYCNLGDLAKARQTAQGYAQAEEWYRKTMALSEQNLSTNATYETRRDLAIDYGRIGDLERRKRTPEGDAAALKWYKLALELYEQNHKVNPSFQTRRDLALDYNRIADILRRKQTYQAEAEAEQWTNLAMRLHQENYQINPNLESRRDLSADYNRQGDLARAKQTPQGYAEAEQWYRKMLELDQLNYAASPSYSTRRDLSVDYNRLGDLERRKQTPESLAEAERLYLLALEMAEENYRVNPNYTIRRDLCISYNRLGDFAKNKKTPEGDAEAEQFYLKMLRLDEQNHADNPSIETARDLAIDYGRLATMAMQKETAEGNEQAKLWLTKALPLNLQNYRTNPTFQGIRDLAVIYCRLGALAKRGNTWNDVQEAIMWYRKAVKLQKESHSIRTCYDSHRDLSISYFQLGDLYRMLKTADNYLQAQQWYLLSLQHDLEKYDLNPCAQSKQDLRITYGRLHHIATLIGTPESLAEAEQWLAKRKALEET